MTDERASTAAWRGEGLRPGLLGTGWGELGLALEGLTLGVPLRISDNAWGCASPVGGGVSVGTCITRARRGQWALAQVWRIMVWAQRP